MSINDIFTTKTKGSWIETKREKHFPDSTGFITIRGFECSKCGFFRHIKHGKSKFCEDCGTRMEVG